MHEPIIYITLDTLYATKLVAGKQEFWRIPYSLTNVDAIFQDVATTLGTKVFHLVLADNIPLIVSNSADLAESYQRALTGLGYTIASTRVVGKTTSLEDLVSPLVDPQAITGFRVGSLEDLQDHQRTSWTPILKTLAIIIAIILVATGAWLLFGSTLTPQPTSMQNPTPSPTPTPAVPSPNNQEYKIQIQNGSGVVGVASKLSARLEAEGFLVGDVSNADNYNYPNAVLRTTPNLPTSIKQKIQSILVDQAWEEEKLPESSPYDIVIIIGQDSSLSN